MTWMITDYKMRRIVFKRGKHKKTACMHRVNKAQCKTKLKLVMEIRGGHVTPEECEGEIWFARRWCMTDGDKSEELEVHGVIGQGVTIWCRRYFIEDLMIRKELKGYRINTAFPNETRKGNDKEIARGIDLKEARMLTIGKAVRYGEYVGRCP